jgi:hypothetical protein
MQRPILTINDGEPVGDEDAAKSYRGIRWASFTLIMMIVIAALLFLVGVIKLNLGGGSDQIPERPASESAN